MSVHAQPAPSCQRMDDNAAQDQGEEGGVLPVGGLYIAQLYSVPLELGKSLSCDVLKVNLYSYICTSIFSKLGKGIFARCKEIQHKIGTCIDFVCHACGGFFMFNELNMWCHLSVLER